MGGMSERTDPSSATASSSSRPGARQPVPIELLVKIAAVVLLVVACLMILRPFIAPILWAAILCYASWPVYRRIRDRLGGRRVTAAIVMILLFTLTLVFPLAVVTANLAEGVSEGVKWTQAMASDPAHPPPEWLVRLPLLGKLVSERWSDWTANADKIFIALRDLAVRNSSWILQQGLALTKGLLQLVLSLLIAFLFFVHGEVVGKEFSDVCDRVAGERTQRLLEITGSTIRGTVHGVLGTALVQGVVAGIGFLIVGMPSALLLGLLTFFVSLVPVGAVVVWLPSALWLFSTGHTGRGIFILLWGGLLVSTVDNFLKPWLTSRGAKLPFVLVLLGAIGGIFAFGFIGVFIGPTLLAVGYCVMREWSVGRKAAPAPATPQS